MLVLDTDVIVAAVRSSSGASAAILAMAIRGELEVAISAAMVLEYEAVALREEHLDAGRTNVDEVRAIIDSLVVVGHHVEPHFRWRPQLRDPGDELVLEAAVNGRASAIVTFNRRDFLPAARRFGLEVVLPREILEMKR